MIIGCEFAYRVLRCFPTPCNCQLRLNDSTAPSPSKLEAYWGPGIYFTID